MTLQGLTAMTIAMFTLATAGVAAAQAADPAPRPPRAAYQPSAWQPRVILPAADALRGDFFPPSPKVATVDYDDPEFEDRRLSPPPPPGVHPRVLLTPADAELIRANIARGDAAPATFRSMWTRVSRKRNALYAYLAQDHELGQKLASELVAKARGLGPKLDALDRYPDRDNLWTAEKSMSAAGDPNVPGELWQMLNYDLLHQWLDEDERALVRGVIARATAGRTSNFMAIPDHYLINNHQCFGMTFMSLLLCIEGEEGFDQQVYALGVRKMRAMLDHYLTRQGMCYETIKGWLPVSVYVAVARRERDLLKHSHLRGKIDFFLQALRWERPNLARPLAWRPPGDAEAGWVIRDEMRASAFHFIWMMKYFRPQSRPLDFLYQASLSSHDFLTNPDARWPDPVGIDDELLLLFAQDPLRGPDDEPIDWTDQANLDTLNLPLSWHDDQRGYLVARNSWRKDDLAVQFACKSEYYYGGHEGTEHGRFTFWADGVNWALDNNALFYKHGGLHNQVTVDGLSTLWPPVAGQWLGVRDTPAGVSAAGDYKDGYSFTKVTQVHPLDFPSARTTYTAMFSAGNDTLSRGYQLAFHDEMVRFYDGFAHTDYGTWSGEHRLLDGYRPWNPMRRAFRTLQLGRGQRPYLLVLDDIQKDDHKHEYAWNMVLPDDVQLLRVTNAPDLLGGVIPADPLHPIDLVLGRLDTPRNQNARAFFDPLFNPQRGAPQLLVRLLRRNTEGYTLPRVEQVERFNVLSIPARAVTPDYVVLLFPHRAGDPLPKTTWSDDGQQLTIDTGRQVDVYRLRRTDAGRTVFALEREGEVVQQSNLPPAAPRLIVRGEVFDRSDARHTRDEAAVPHYLVADRLAVAFERPAMQTPIHYTLDGSDPTASSPRYVGPIEIAATSTLKARVIDPSWPCGPAESEVLTATFERRPPAEALLRGGERTGLLADVHEIKTVIYDDRGFWHAGRVMLPDLSRSEPLVSAVTDAFALPHAVPAAPYVEQRKGFYRFRGFVNAPADGVYRFAVDSCGPVTLDVAGQVAIEHIGQFHQQQAVRHGEASLSAGWHPIELVVTDPLFWKINTDGPMPLKLSYRIDGGEATAMAAEQLSCTPPAGVPLQAAPAVVTLHPATDLPVLEPGVERRDYDRSAAFRPFVPPPHDWLDVDSLVPTDTRLAEHLADNAANAVVVTYEGYFHAPVPGDYTFDLPARADRGIDRDQVRTDSIDRNQLRIGGEVVVQRGVPGRNPVRTVRLAEAGHYPISIRLGKSRAVGRVTYPDGQTLRLTAAGLFRPARPTIRPEHRAVAASFFELYEPATVRMSLPTTASSLTLRYTLDGSAPTAASPAYDAPLRIDSDLTVTAAGFDGERAATVPVAVRFARVTTPTAGLIVRLDGSTLAPPAVAGTTPWVAPGTRLLAGERAALAFHGGADARHPPAAASRPVDLNLDKGTSGAGLRLGELRLPRNAITVAGWFRLGDVKSVQLFGKWGINSIGKRYQTVLCEIRDGRLRGDPGAVVGGKLTAGNWHHVALVADDGELAIYLDGRLVGRGDGTDRVVADSLDFCVNAPADVSDLRVYGRSLSAEDIERLAAR